MPAQRPSMTRRQVAPSPSANVICSLPQRRRVVFITFNANRCRKMLPKLAVTMRSNDLEAR